MIPFLTLVRVAFRTLFIQAGFSPDAMQTLGLLFALDPAWRHLYPDDERRREAVRRHLTPFNTHPYAAAALVGGILHYEEKLARGEGSPEEVTRFKQTMMGPFAALGDGFFWLSLRPATGALGVALVPLLGLWAPLVFLVLYNAVHLATRGWLFARGYRLGSALVLRVSALKVPMWSNRLRAISALCAGGMGAWFAVQEASLSSEWAVLGALGIGVLGVWALEKKVSPLAVLYGAAGVAVLAGALW
ncbi:MAG: PTS system mannose/fructose/sorbose family transporter subunit IID [Myxococcota bacterium]